MCVDDVFGDRRVVLNVRPGSVEDAIAAADEYGSGVLVGVMAKGFADLDDAIARVRMLHKSGVRVSAGLGDGAADQWERALTLATTTRPVHLNQVFPAAALSQRDLTGGDASTLVNALVRPTGSPGLVDIATGPSGGAGSVPVDVALGMAADMGVRSIKLFPISGSDRLPEVAAVASAVADRGMVLEPTGGITPGNLDAVLGICLEAGASYVMPHLYGSLSDPQTGRLRRDLLAFAMNRIDEMTNGRG